MSESSDTQQGEHETSTNDPYFYTKLDEFTSEVYKIEISNFPGKIGYTEMKKRMKSIQLQPKKIKIIPRCPVIYMTFCSEEERCAALEALNGHVWKNNKLSAKKALPCADPMVLKRKGELSDCPKEKKAKVDESDVPIGIRLNNSVNSLWQMPYSEQLMLKYKTVADCLKHTYRQLERDGHVTSDWMKSQIRIHGSHFCNLLPIIPSPITENYRNKCEFTIGVSIEGKEKVVGFRLGQYRCGSSTVGPPDECVIMPDSMKKVVKIFERYIATSPHPTFRAETHKGCWKQLTVRTSNLGHIMAFPEFRQENLTQKQKCCQQEEITAEILRMKSYFTEGPGKDSGITSMYFNTVRNQATNSTGDSDLAHVLGEKTIEEEISGLKFSISPEAFFQINTRAAELLYNTIGQWVCEGDASTNESACDKNDSLNNGVSVTQNEVDVKIENESAAEQNVQNETEADQNVEKESETAPNVENESTAGSLPNEPMVTLLVGTLAVLSNESKTQSNIESEIIAALNTQNESESIQVKNESEIVPNVDAKCVSKSEISNSGEKADDGMAAESLKLPVECEEDKVAQENETKVDNGTTLLDVCCGTGTIGLSLAKKVEKVIGIELCEQAVRNAEQNAINNGITNAEFHCGKAEHLIPKVISSLQGKNVVAVVDPPRPGLHKSVVHTLRGCETLKKLIYVSCSPKSVQTNFYDFMRPRSKRMNGDPFTLVKAVPVDLFPHTNHCELVLLFQR